MLLLARTLIFCWATWQISFARGTALGRRTSRQRVENELDAARAQPRDLVTTQQIRRQIQERNDTQPDESLQADEVNVNCFQTSSELPLQLVSLIDCVRIVGELLSVPGADVDVSWGAAMTKNPTYRVPRVLPPRGSCTATIEAWPPDDEFAFDSFSTSELAHVARGIITACLTGPEPYGGTSLVGPHQRMRLTLWGPLRSRQISQPDLYRTVNMNSSNGLIETQ